jgi:hypothetical protein
MPIRFRIRRIQDGIIFIGLWRFDGHTLAKVT